MILVTAATAPVGRSIVEQLVAAGHPVRALTRNAKEADLPAAAELVEGDLTDPDSLEVAMRDVTAVFLLAVVPGFASAFLAAAREAGVERIVFQSSAEVVDGATEQPNDIAAFHADVEQAIRDSGLGWTFLRLDVSSADALQWAFDVPGQLSAGDVVKAPYGDAAGSPIHPADFAAVAVAALLDAGHTGAVHHVTGPRSLTHREQVALIGSARGRDVSFQEVDPETARSMAGPFVPIDLLLATWERHTHRPAPVTDTVQRVTGRAPRSVDEWAADYPAP
ncbi:SDR family oxidoreductase [Nocardioides sp. SYSU DS0651]|uniref:SDR family oxidoreductase n=1 Tax=Nocardioides sp. SYSU DS0651 TaxID=3415955 RepID=UPI003F4B8409